MLEWYCLHDQRTLRVYDGLSSAAGDASGRTLGEVGDASRAAPQVRHTRESPSLTALCPLGHHYTLNFPGGAGGC